MRRPTLRLVRGRHAWRQCDHASTRIDGDGRVRLSYAEAHDEERVSTGVFAAFQLARRPAVVIPPPPDRCHEDGFVRLDPRWGPLARASRDRCGRIWVIEGQRLEVVDDALRPLRTPAVPAGIDLVDVAATDGFVVLVGTRGGAPIALRGGWDQPFVELAVDWPAGALPISAGGGPVAAIAVLRGPDAPAALVVTADRAAVVPIPTLEDPLHVVGTRDGRFHIAEISAPPGGRTLFTEFTLDDDGLHAGDERLARFFDGVAAVEVGCTVKVTTSHGLAPLVATRPALATLGRVETFLLDSERYSCRWHRVFVDACVPEGCAVRVSARSSDEMWPSTVRAVARPPAEEPLASTGDWVLGSRTPDDDEGWVPVGALDRRAGHADIPFAPPRGDFEFDTFEGLLKGPPGRYLWLRIELEGSGRGTPVLDAVRVSLPRTSLLDQLPRWWGADPATADPMERFLALFEAVLTETDQRIEALPWMFDPRVCPPDALEWLGSFVGLAFDRRVSVATRRRLLVEVGFLWRWRGTVRAIERLTSILADAETRVVEAYRTRRHTGAVLGMRADDARAIPGSVLGPGLQLGGGPASADEPEPGDPVRDFVRRTAHRFSVVVLKPKDATLHEVLELAIETHKPAHTVHEICWLDAGFRLGVTTMVGVGTRLGPVATATPAIVGQSPLGGQTTLSRPVSFVAARDVEPR